MILRLRFSVTTRDGSTSIVDCWPAQLAAWEVEHRQALGPVLADPERRSLAVLLDLAHRGAVAAGVTELDLADWVDTVAGIELVLDQDEEEATDAPLGLTQS